MKIEELLENLPIGGCVPKRVLAVLKRTGLIFDYSYYGYLESRRIHYWSEDCHGKYVSETWTEFGRALNPDDLGGTNNPYKSHDDIPDGTLKSTIEYKGFKFTTKYFDGCFKPYLIKSGGPTKDKKIVNHSICLWGAII